MRVDLNFLDKEQRTRKVVLEIQRTKFNECNLLNYTGLSLQKLEDIKKNKPVELTDDELWCLEFRMFNREYRRLLF